MIELNGKYWTIQELANEAGIKYIQLYTLIQKHNVPVIKLGQTFLVENTHAQELIDMYKKIMHDSVTYNHAIKDLHIGHHVLYKLKNLGLPVITMGNRSFIPNNVYEVLKNVIREYQEKYKCIPRNKAKEIIQEITNRLDNELDKEIKQ